jgi:hypothetical protein
MQLKGFLLGVAIASLAWLAWPQIVDRDTGTRGFEDPAHAWMEAHVGWHEMSPAERQAHVAEMRELWQGMTPEQREAHRGMMQCPYAGPDARSRGRHGQPSGEGLRTSPEPLEI